ncbi:hypothetical protein BSLG_009343 [Batrachochytrium salamandrivorans]|nr:hypothetical protein BSLG_009343 [Batrachochytrium salamandrivorans]
MISTALVVSFAAAFALAAPAALDFSIARMNDPSREITINGGDIQYTMGSPLLLGKVPIYLIYYGNWTNSQKHTVETFTNGVGTSDWWGIEKKYYYQKDVNSTKVYISSDVFVGGTVSDNYSLGKALSGKNLPSLVQKYIDAGTFPESSNAVYYILNSADVTEQHGKSSFCDVYCGYHSEATLTSGNTIYYAQSGSLPDSCVKGCAPPANQQASLTGDIGVDAMISVMGHELAEVISDPSLLNRAWNDFIGYENGDKCAYTYGATTVDSNGASYNMGWGGLKFLVQQNWDPETQACAELVILPIYAAISLAITATSQSYL